MSRLKSLRLGTITIVSVYKLKPNYNYKHMKNGVYTERLDTRYTTTSEPYGTEQ